MRRPYTVTLYVVRCNRCGHQTRNVADGFSSEEQAVEEALRYGWSIYDDADICPTCTLKEPCS